MFFIRGIDFIVLFIEKGKYFKIVIIESFLY